VSDAALAQIRSLFAAGRADEDETASAIRTTLRETSRLVDPHTAVGLAVAEKEPRDPAIPMVVLGPRIRRSFRTPSRLHAECGRRCPNGSPTCCRGANE
jgi:threonine synthase